MSDEWQTFIHLWCNELVYNPLVHQGFSDQDLLQVYLPCASIVADRHWNRIKIPQK